jgi:hypothetical protein
MNREKCGKAGSIARKIVQHDIELTKMSEELRNLNAITLAQLRPDLFKLVFNAGAKIATRRIEKREAAMIRRNLRSNFQGV